MKALVYLLLLANIVLGIIWLGSGLLFITLVLWLANFGLIYLGWEDAEFTFKPGHAMGSDFDTPGCIWGLLNLANFIIIVLSLFAFFG